MNTQISKLHDAEIQKYLLFIESIVTEGFIDTGIDIVKEKQHLLNEIAIQSNRVLQSPNQYLLARQNNNIVGSIAYMTPCEAVQIAAKKLNIPLTSLTEIVAVYVHKKHRLKGIGSALFTTMLKLLKQNNITYAALSTGYAKGKAFWRHRLGPESLVLPDYYEGHPCFVWIRKIDDIL